MMVGLITGVGRQNGLGYETARQLLKRGFCIVCSARDAQKGAALAQTLGKQHPGRVLFCHLDTSDTDSVQAAARFAAEQCGHLDLLVNNAGGYYEAGMHPLQISIEHAQTVLETNLWGAWRVTMACYPLLKQGENPIIVNVSSGVGQLGSLRIAPLYGISKLALNGLTIALADKLKGDGIKVNAVCPGWVATDMGGSGGRPLAAGAAGIVWASTLPAGPEPSGGFFRDGQPIDW